jgi:hypothetical protein
VITVEADVRLARAVNAGILREGMDDRH